MNLFRNNGCKVKSIGQGLNKCFACGKPRHFADVFQRVKKKKRNVAERDIRRHVAEVRVERVTVVEEVVQVIIGNPIVRNVIHSVRIDKLIRWTMTVERSLLLCQLGKRLLR